MDSVDEPQDREQIEDPVGRARFLKAIGFFSIFVLALVAASVSLDTEWSSSGGSTTTQSAPPPVDCDDYRHEEMVPGFDAAILPMADHWADAEEYVDDYRFSEASSSFEKMEAAAAKAPSDFRDLFRDAPCEWGQREGSMLTATDEMLVAAEEVAREGVECMEELEERPEDAWFSQECRRYNAKVEVLLARSEDYGDQRDWWMR